MNIDDPMTRSKLTVVDTELLGARNAVTHTSEEIYRF